MDVEVRQSDGVTVVALKGRLDLASAQSLRRSVQEAVDCGARKVLLDLAEVPFVDSSGLGAIVGSLKTARQAGGDLRIARPQEQARMLLELTAMDKVLQPYATLEAAFGQR